MHALGWVQGNMRVGAMRHACVRVGAGLHEGGGHEACMHEGGCRAT